MIKFNLSPKSINTLIYQRSQYIGINPHKVNEAYLTEMRMIYSQIEPFLQKNVDKILDIGCGMSGIDVFLSKHYPKASITLLDKEGMSEAKGAKIDFHKEVGTFGAYHSFEGARELLKQNNITPICIDIGKQLFPKTKYDLIISLLSWGFHYPLSTYAKQVTYPCDIIVDVRKFTEDGTLGKGTVISEGPKHQRKIYKIR